jgi:hypothetical protein
MALLRRRPNPPTRRNYQAYKPFLREDFEYRCVYCDVHENELGGPRIYTVEHFKPKSIFTELETTYTNLLYGCAICNTYKGNDWPSNDPLADGKGYIDPCDHDYADHIALSPESKFEGQTDVGRYMIKRMHLNRPQLITVRKDRLKWETLCKETLALYDDILLTIEEKLTGGTLTADKKRELKAKRKDLKAKRKEHLATLKNRWKPKFSLDDFT